MRVFGNVVQLMSRVSVFDILSNQFPISGSYGLASVFLVKLPIQEVMLPLFSLSGQSREYGQSQPAAIKSLIEPASIVPGQ